MGQRLSDPAWKSGPSYPEPSSSEHAIYPEDFGHGDHDIDGFGVDEAEQVEGEPLVTIQEQAVCSRDGCDAAHRRRLLFTTHTLSDDKKALLDAVSGPDEPAAYVWEHVERIGPESIEVPIEGDNLDSELRQWIDGTTITITAEQIIEDEPSGSCYGRIEPDPEPEWRDI